jgi:hypothetical protein
MLKFAHGEGWLHGAYCNVVFFSLNKLGLLLLGQGVGIVNFR